MGKPDVPPLTTEEDRELEQDIRENFYQTYHFDFQQQQVVQWTRLKEEEMDTIVKGSRHNDPPEIQWRVTLPDGSLWMVYYYLSGVFDVESILYDCRQDNRPAAESLQEGGTSSVTDQ
jgi:hypothetical protein